MAVEETVIRRVRVTPFLHGAAIVALVAAGYFGFRASQPAVAYALYGAALLVAVDWWLRRATLTSRRLLVRRGPFGAKLEIIDCYKTGEIEVKKSRLGEALGFGDVIVHPVESDAVLTRLRNVGDPGAMQELIREVRMNSASYVIGF